MSYQEDVEAFMMQGDQEFPAQQAAAGPVLSASPIENDDQVRLYMNLVNEEYMETVDAFLKGDIVELADGLADMVWVILGLASTLNIDFDAVWQEVKASNMSKFVDGKAIKNPKTGKIMKPDTYFKPDIKAVLGL